MDYFFMTWLYNGLPFTDDMIETYSGFVYIITNLHTNRKYIGQKNLWMPKVRMVKGKKKRTKVVSDYKDYYGSNEELKQHVKDMGPEFFKREILYLCKSKGEQNYIELREQIDRRVLENPESYYNGYVGGRINRSHIKNLLNK